MGGPADDAVAAYGSLDEVLAPGRDGGALAAAYERDIAAAMDRCAAEPAAAERLHASFSLAAWRAGQRAQLLAGVHFFWVWPGCFLTW